MEKREMLPHREFLKDSLRLTIDFRQTDQNQGVAPPPIQKPPREGQSLISLPQKEVFSAVVDISLLEAISRRQSRRRFTTEPLDLNELSFMLWATQGIRRGLAPGTALRTVPSAGCRHAFETYLLVTHISDLDAGIYRYLPLDHALVLEQNQSSRDLRKLLVPAVLGQDFVAGAAVTFVWTVIPYRMEWRYGLAAHRVISMDVGHVCQNLYLASEAISAGTCAIAAYHQQLMDHLLGVDGDDEFTIYLAPVGKV